MNSVEKIHGFRQELMTAEPPDQETAQLMQVAQNMMPFILPMLPSDPATLDEQLLALAKWSLSMRSDEAETEAAVYVKGPAPAQVETPPDAAA